MKITINKKELISLIAENTKEFGNSFLCIATDNEGYVYCAEQIPGEDHIIMRLSGLENYIDENQNYPGTDDYDSKGVAEYIVENEEFLNLNIEYENDEDVEIAFIDYEILSENEYNADHYSNHLCRLGGCLDNGNDYGLGEWTYQFEVEVTNQEGETKEFTVAFQPEERSDGMKAYSGYDIAPATCYGYDADQSSELEVFCDYDTTVINELWRIAHKAAKAEYERLIEMLENGEIEAKQDY